MDYNWSFLKHKWGTTISVLGGPVLPNSSDYYLTRPVMIFHQLRQILLLLLFCKIIFHNFQSIHKTSNFTLVISTKLLYVNQLDDVTLVTYLHHLLTKQCSEREKKSINVSLWSDWSENWPVTLSGQPVPSHQRVCVVLLICFVGICMSCWSWTSLMRTWRRTWFFQRLYLQYIYKCEHI